MADYTVRSSKTAQLVGYEVDRITLTNAYDVVEVMNLDGSAEIWILVDNNGDPSPGADDMNLVPAAIGAVTLPAPDTRNTVVRLVSPGTPRYHVRGVDRPGI